MIKLFIISSLSYTGASILKSNRSPHLPQIGNRTKSFTVTQEACISSSRMMSKLFHSSQRDSCAIHKRIFRALSFNKSAEKALFLPVLLVRNQVERPRALLPDSLTHSQVLRTYFLSWAPLQCWRFVESGLSQLQRILQGVVEGSQMVTDEWHPSWTGWRGRSSCLETGELKAKDGHSASFPLPCLLWFPSTKSGWRKMPKMMAFQLGVKDASEPAAGGRLYIHSYSRDMEINPMALVLSKQQLTVA